MNLRIESRVTKHVNSRLTNLFTPRKWVHWLFFWNLKTLTFILKFKDWNYTYWIQTNRIQSINNTDELLTFNRAALIILMPVDWCNVILSDDVSINNVALLDETTKRCVLGTNWLLKRMRKLCMSLSFDVNINVNIRIDTHFADIHGFMNVALVGAIPRTAFVKRERRS